MPDTRGISVLTDPADVNILTPRQNGRHFADDILKCIFLNENVWILIVISPRFVPNGPINNMPTLVLIMAWCRLGDKPSFEPIMHWFHDAYMRQGNISSHQPSWMLTHWLRDKMVVISQMAHSNAFSWIKITNFGHYFKFVPKGPINDLPTLIVFVFLAYFRNLYTYWSGGKTIKTAKTYSHFSNHWTTW